MKLQTAIAAPKGARWVSETVVRDPKTNRTVVDCLILTFDNLDDMMAHYGKDTVMHFATGTSFRVIQQGVWRLSLNGTAPADDAAQRRDDEAVAQRADSVRHQADGLA